MRINDGLSRSDTNLRDLIVSCHEEKNLQKGKEEKANKDE